MAEKPLEVLVGEMLRTQGLTIGLAESSTGGLVGHRITEVPGSSDYFVGSIVAYARRVQEQLVGVSHASIEEYGVVSERVAREMARRVRRRLRTNIGLSVTGIAGPDGRRSPKPTGLTYIGLSADDLEACERHVFDGDRSGNKWQSAGAALSFLRRYLDRRAQLPELQHIVDGVDPDSRPRLAIVQPAKDGIGGSTSRNGVGVLSGAFNPMTEAHVQLAELALERYELAEVMLELPKSNVDKDVYGASLAERLWMLKRFVNGRPRFSVGMCSHGRFIDKANAIRATYPAGTEIYFIIGYDTLVRVFDPKYYDDLAAELQELFDRSQFIAANRSEHGLTDVEAFLERPICRPFADRVHLIELGSFHAGLSSTQVRERLKRGEPIAELVPDEILPLMPLTGLAEEGWLSRN